MNNTNKLLLVALFLAVFAFAPLSGAQNAGSMYGTQVLTTSGEFRPDLDAGVDIGDDDNADPATDLSMIWSDGEDDEIFTDDLLLLDIDDDGDASRYDLVIATDGYDDTASGELVQSGMIDLQNLAFDEVEMFCSYADVNENGFLDEEDFVYLTTAAFGESLDATATGGAAFTVRLTENDDGEFGSWVRTVHDDFDDYADLVGDDVDEANDDDGDSDNICEFAFYDSGNDDEFEGGSDRGYVVLAGGVGAGDPVPLYSVVVFGSDLGTLTSTDSQDFSPEVLELDDWTALEVVRYEAGTDDNAGDDVYAVNTGTGGGSDSVFSQDDLIISTGGFGGSAVGDLITLGDSLLIGEGDSDGVNLLHADVDENGEFNTGDFLFACDSATLIATDADDFCIRITDTDGGDAGTRVRTGDDDLDDWEDNTDDIGAVAEVCFFDSDNDGDFDGGDDLLFLDADGCTDGDLVELHSIWLFGEGQTFGTSFGAGDESFVPSLTDDDDASIDVDSGSGCDVLRHDAGTDEDFFDDVFVGDVDCDGAIGQYDLVIASAEGYGGPALGDLISLEDELLLDGSEASIDSDVFFVDANEDGIYNEGDWVIVCDDEAVGDNAGLGNTDENDFCIRMTDTDGGDAGTLVRTGDDDLSDWEDEVDDESDGAFELQGEIAFYDSDNDGEFEGDEDGDLLFLTPQELVDGGRVPQYSLRLWGDFSQIPDQSGSFSSTSSSSTVTDTTTSSSSSSSSSSSTSVPVPPGGSDSGSETESDDDNSTPGFELVALVGALAVALVLVRRKL